MDIDTTRIRELLDQRDGIDAELAGIFGTKERKPIVCGSCGQSGHTARTCEQRKKGGTAEV